MDKAKKAVQVLRATLLEQHGFQIANAVGDLVRGNERVATRYAGGEFYITSWTRREGEIIGPRDSENRRIVRITDKMLLDYPGYTNELAFLIGQSRGHEYNGPGSSVLDRVKANQS